MTLDPSTTMPANEREKLACDGSVGQGWAPVRHNLHLFLSCSTAYDNGRPFLFSFGRPLSGCENKRKRRELCLVGKKAFLLLRCFLSCERPEVTRRLSSLDKGLTWRCLTALPFDGIESRGQRHLHDPCLPITLGLYRSFTLGSSFAITWRLPRTSGESMTRVIG
jgi:hypothetical protein